MNIIQHQQTTILSDDVIEDWTIHLITQCINFYDKALNTKAVFIKDMLGDRNNIGLAIADIEGFVIYWRSIIELADKYQRDGVAPIATQVFSIVDTVFHEMHHVESYHEDRAWVIKHREEEEKNANKMAKYLAIEFFKNTRLEVPIKEPFIYKSGQSLITDLREYFNILLDDKEEWDRLPEEVVEEISPLPARENLVNTVTDTIDPLGATLQTPPPAQPPENMGEKAMALYNACFAQIFGGCIPTPAGFSAPERIIDNIPSQGIVSSAKTMTMQGLLQELPVGQELSGLIFKTSKLPAYEFTLIDGKKRKIIPQNPLKKDQTGNFSPSAIKAQNGSKIGYVIDMASNKFLLRYENGVITTC